MTTQAEQLGVPSDWPGSVPEYLVYVSLITRQGKIEGVVIDFLFNNPPDLAINVQGEYYHYGLGSTFMQNDIIIRAQMAGQGINLIFIDESDILEDVDYYVRQALNYRDHSQLGGGR